MDGISPGAPVRRSGVRVGEVSYFGSQPWPLPASLMVGFLARAESVDITVDGHEIEEARWFTREEAFGGATDGLVQMPSGISISRSLNNRIALLIDRARGFDYGRFSRRTYTVPLALAVAR